jgi:hypothetical protein
MEWIALPVVAAVLELVLVLCTCRPRAADGPAALTDELRQERERRVDRG